MHWSNFLLSNLFCLSHELLQLNFRMLYLIPEFRYIRVIKADHIMYKDVVAITESGVKGDSLGHWFQIRMTKHLKCWPRLTRKTRLVGSLDMSPENIKSFHQNIPKEFASSLIYGITG